MSPRTAEGQQSTTNVFEHLDQIVERLAAERHELLGNEFAPGRAARLAAVFAAEAEAWSQFYELSSLRLVWRAALTAEAGARANAVLWAQRAAAESWAAERVGAPRPAAFTTTSGR